jgi:hypothetical protein
MELNFSGFVLDEHALAYFVNESMTPRDYRNFHAIPRYLEKRTRRSFAKKSLHPSRILAAKRKLRIQGKFAKA